MLIDHYNGTSIMGIRLEIWITRTSGILVGFINLELLRWCDALPHIGYETFFHILLG